MGGIITTSETSALLFRPQEYHRPSTIQEAISFLKLKGAVPICGGTDVLVKQKPETKYLVDLRGLPLSYLKRVKNGLLIGATTSIRQIELSSILNPPPYDVLHDAVRDFGSVQIRNMASVGGNVCNGIPSADCPPALIALNTVAKVAGPSGSRRVLLEKIYRHVRKLTLKRSEILTELKIPKFPPRTAAAFFRLSRSIVDISLVSAAVRITLDEANRVKDSRVVLGAVAPVPLRARKAEKRFLGKKIDQRTITEVAHAASLESRPIDDVRATANYRREMVEVLVGRAIDFTASKLKMN